MSPTQPIRLIFSDKNPVARIGFRSIIKEENNIELISEASNGKELCYLVEKHVPDVVITDIALPELDGIKACLLIKSQFPAIGVIGFSEFNETGMVSQMLEAGASSYLLKIAPKKEILEAIEIVYKGGFYETDATLGYFSIQLLNRSKRSTGSVTFSSRELQIIKLICTERSNKEIANELSLSVRTVEDHRKNIQRKTGSRNMVGIVIYAIRHKLFEVSI